MNLNDIETGSLRFNCFEVLFVHCLHRGAVLCPTAMDSSNNANTGNGPTKQQAIVMWVIWFSFLQSAFLFTWFIGGGIPEGENAAEPMAAAFWLICFGGLAAAAVVRWLMIPKVGKFEQQLTTMIAGLALCEMPVFVSLFGMRDYPQNQIAVLIVAVLSIIQFAPSYATPGYKQV